MTACTEKEAAEKWCPHMRKALVGNMAMFAGNIDAEGGFAPATCIGSRCMQWRWRDDDKWVGGEATRRGYCGLAGKP